MKILDFYYNDSNRMLYVEFSTEEDGDLFYRAIELHFNDVEYYSADIIYENEMDELEEFSVIEMLSRYLQDNDLPDQLNL